MTSASVSEIPSETDTDLSESPAPAPAEKKDSSDSAKSEEKKPEKPCFEHVFVVGAGGIGSHLIEPITRFLAYHERGTKNITIIDGDKYEEKNRTRQIFPAEFVNVNKADVTAGRIKASMFAIRSIPEFVSRDKFRQVLGNSGLSPGAPILVIAAVDNHATRRDLIQALDSIDRDYQNFVFISGGNGYHNGQVMVYARLEGKPLTVHPFEKYEELKYPTDHIPGTGCLDEAPSTPQLITANQTAALGIMWTVRAMLDGKNWFEELHFDTEKMKMVPQGEPRILSVDNALIGATIAAQGQDSSELSIPAGIFAGEE